MEWGGWVECGSCVKWGGLVELGGWVEWRLGEMRRLGGVGRLG